MTLEKAIKEMTIHLAEGNVPHTKELEASLKLGIEAMQMLKEFRSGPIPHTFWILPGETDE